MLVPLLSDCLGGGELSGCLNESVMIGQDVLSHRPHLTNPSEHAAMTKYSD